MMDAVGLAIAALLPPDYQGAYADDVTDLDGARRLQCDLFQSGPSVSEKSKLGTIEPDADH